MKHNYGWVVVSVAALALSACGGNGDPQPLVTVSDLAAGSYVVSVGDANTPVVGKYYADAAGNRLLVLADSSDRASQLYRREAGKEWVGVPASDKDVAVKLLQSNTLVAKTVDLAAMAGSYTTLVATGTVASFTVQTNGTIVAGTTACKLAGSLSAGTLANTLKLSLTATGCGTTVPASSTGVAAVDSDYAPASLRLVADNGAQLVDLWAYRQ